MPWPGEWNDPGLDAVGGGDPHESYCTYCPYSSHEINLLYVA